MPDVRHHRGAHPEDAELFAPAHAPALRAAFVDLCWLLDRGYALRSSLALTGDRHALTQRQRLAVARGACSREQLVRRQAHRVAPEALAGRELWLDGYNVLITLEAALAGGVILLGRDGCCRDMASLHGTYRAVEETRRAAELVGGFAQRSGVTRCHWLLDQPVGNSGRLRSFLLEVSAEAGWPWTVELAFNPDAVLGAASEIVASSDSVVLDRCSRWCNVAREIIAAAVPAARVLDLCVASPAESG